MCQAACERRFLICVSRGGLCVGGFLLSLWSFSSVGRSPSLWNPDAALPVEVASLMPWGDIESQIEIFSCFRMVSSPRAVRILWPRQRTIDSFAQ